MIVTSLDPVRLADDDLWVAEGRFAVTGEGTRIDCSDALAVPGNICAHTHLYSALARGMPNALEAPASFLEILQRVWWRLDRALDEETVRASALVGGMEALLSGTTTLIDHHASPNAIDGPERAQAGIAENRRFLARIESEHPPLVRAMAGAHASFTLSDETLAACAELGPLHVHAAEDRVDLGAVYRLAAAGALDDRTLLAHGVHVDDDEIALVRSAGATVAHNARSNMNNNVGRARVAALDPHVALGTDGIGADMFEESRAAYFRLREDNVAAAPSWPLARLAEGARFAGHVFGEPLLGTLEPGAPADLVVLDYAAPAPLDAAGFAGHWLFGLGAGWVRDVMVAGEWVVRDRCLTRVDRDELVAAARDQAKRLWTRLDEIPAHAFEPGVRV